MVRLPKYSNVPNLMSEKEVKVGIGSRTSETAPVQGLTTKKQLHIASEPLQFTRAGANI